METGYIIRKLTYDCYKEGWKNAYCSKLYSDLRDAIDELERLKESDSDSTYYIVKAEIREF